MKKSAYFILALCSLLPAACLAASDTSTSAGLGTILGSIIVGAIFIIAIIVEKKKKEGNKGALYQEVNITKTIKKIFNKNKVDSDK